LIPPINNEHLLKAGMEFTSNVQSNVSIGGNVDGDADLNDEDKKTEGDAKSILKSNPNLSSKPAGEIGIDEEKEDADIEV
jgi:hypothetical protein